MIEKKRWYRTYPFDVNYPLQLKEYEQQEAMVESKRSAINVKSIHDTLVYNLSKFLFSRQSLGYIWFIIRTHNVISYKALNYHAFGNTITERSVSFGEKYRYGFNNQEHVGKLVVYYAFEHRMHSAAQRFLAPKHYLYGS